MPSPSTITRSAVDLAAIDRAIPAHAPASAARLAWRRGLAKWSRWLHIYGSMSSLAVVLFFAITGITLNHQDWFASQQVTLDRHGTMTTAWLAPAAAGVAVDNVNKLQIVEFLRASAGVRGALGEFRVDDGQCQVEFKAPGYWASAVIDRATGRYDLTEGRMGFAAIINDLHKGRDTGPVWKGVIDVVAALLVFISLTGLVLLYFLHKYRIAGVMLLGAGALISYLVYVVWVP